MATCSTCSSPSNKQDNIDEYQHSLLVGDEIRLIRLLPGVDADRIRIQIWHVPLKSGEKSCSPRLSYNELQKTVPSGWKVYETLRGEYLFRDMTREDDHPTNDTENITLQLEHPSLKVANSLYKLPPEAEIWSREPAFEALSYVWGSADHAESAVVESSCIGESIKAFNIGHNLASALRNIRHKDKSRVLWVDAICINQADNNEKTMQIKRMSDIYRLASRVIAWVGPHQDDSILAISALACLGKQVEVTIDQKVLPCPLATQPTWFKPEELIPFSVKEWQAIDAILQRPWFKRVWTVQEVLLANRLAIVQCGGNVMNWDLLRRALFCCMYKRPKVPARRSRLFATTMTEHWKDSSLGSLLHKHCWRGCADPRDKLYGMLALAPPQFTAAIKPNYSLSTQDIFRDALLIHMDTTKRWELFGCSLNQRTVKIPSWIPDYSQFPDYQAAPTDLASGVSRIWHEYFAPDRLKVKGILFDTVEHTKARFSGDSSAARELMEFWGTSQVFSTPSPESSPIFEAEWPVLDAFCSTLCEVLSTCHRERFPNSSSFPILAELKELFLNWAFPSTTSLTNGASQIFNQGFSQKVSNKALFKTSKGSVGYGFNPFRPGDVACVFLGCSRPLIIRPQAGNTYCLVSWASLYELQDAKGFLGPLPSPWRVQVVPYLSGRYLYRYFNAETHELSKEDPRLGSIPRTWERLPFEKGRLELTGDDPQVFDIFRNVEDGKIIYWDPRMDPKALKEIGVNLETITLV